MKISIHTWPIPFGIRCFPVFLVATLLLAVAAVSAQEEIQTYTNDETGLVLYYSIENGEATVTGGIVPTEGEHKGQLVIPETLGSAPVRAIGNNAFGGSIDPWAPDLTVINVVSPTVEVIGEYAFYICHALENVSLPQVTSVQERAFANCAKLKNLSGFPNLETVHSFAFSDAYLGRESISLPRAVCIKSHAFSNNYSVNSIVLPKVTYIGESAFYACPTTSESELIVSLPEARIVENSAFSEANGIDGILLPKVEEIGVNAFHPCKSLKKVYLGGAPTLGENAFVNTHSDLTIYHHSGYTGYFELGNWKDLKKQVVARPFIRPVEVATQGGLATVRISYAEGQSDWSYGLERTTDLADEESWATPTRISEPANAISDGVTTESHSFDQSGENAAFFRVQANADFCQQ